MPADRTREVVSSKQSNLPQFWQKNKAMMKALESSQMPPKSRLVFKEISTKRKGSNSDHVTTSYDLINIYDNRKNFLEIKAELSDDGSSIVREEIVAAKNTLSNAKTTIIDGSKITNQAQIDWILEMSRNNSCQLFRI